MDTFSSLAVIALAALIHASFQLSVSALTLLSGHALGAQKARTRIWRMTTSFVLGAGVITLLLLSFIALLFNSLYGNDTPSSVWAIACGILVGVGIAIWLFYYRHQSGTSLWIPRSMAHYLSDRTKATKDSAESFGLGLSSVFGEILFIGAPLIISGLVLVQLTPGLQLVGLLLYTVISMLGLLIVWALVGSGHSLSLIQKWRETNKNFLQFAGGGGLIILSFFVYVSQILGGFGS